MGRGVDRVEGSGAVSRPGDIPQDIWDAAYDRAMDAEMSGRESDTWVDYRSVVIIISRAVQEERERCAELAENIKPEGNPFSVTPDWYAGGSHAAWVIRGCPED